MMEERAANRRVRRRAPNACTRCRRQKIKCTGGIPCEQCSRRSLDCNFDHSQNKVLVSQSYLSRLQRNAAGAAGAGSQAGQDPSTPGSGAQGSSAVPGQQGAGQDHENVDVDAPGDEQSEAPDGGNVVRTAVDAGLENPLATPSHTIDTAGRPFWLGVSSNWSFGRKALTMAFEKVSGVPLPATSLLFEGSAYDLGWDGIRTSASVGTNTLPTPDFAVYLINAVKFHASRLFHLFDEIIFMQHFEKFYQNTNLTHDRPLLWYVHYLLILALGKAFVVRTGKGRKPPGAEFYVQAMQMLPDITFLYAQPLQAAEILCCASLYLQCIDSRSAAYNLIGQAMRICVEQGMHRNGTVLFGEHSVQRCREIWWTTYILDRQMSALLGVPSSISDDDITAEMPSFGGSVQKSSAVSVQVKIAKATAVILQTVYSKRGDKGDRFLTSIKEALQTISDANQERNAYFPLDLKLPTRGICRLSAYLHLFHLQCLVLATRPLLFSFWQKRLDANKPLHISSSHGARYLLYVCVNSAQQSLQILNVLQDQCLLESFVPFDRDATFSSAVVLSLATAVDPSLIPSSASWLSTVNSVLEELASKGSLIAEYHRREIEQLNLSLEKLKIMNATETPDQAVPGNAPGMSHPDSGVAGVDDGNLPLDDRFLGEWNSEDGLSGEQLLAVADSLSMEPFDWFTGDMLDADFDLGA